MINSNARHKHTHTQKTHIESESDIDNILIQKPRHVLFIPKYTHMHSYAHTHNAVQSTFVM